MKKISLFLISLSILIIYSSCTQKIYTKYNLFQKGMDSLKNYDYKAPIIQNNDVLSIQIYSATLSQDQVSVFNMGASSASGVAQANSAPITSLGVTYTVDLAGNIVMPIIGSIKAVGQSTTDLSNQIKTKLEIYIKDPIVKVNYINIKVNVLGEVKLPGSKYFTTIAPTIVDAISQSGDFSDNAKRDEVYLIREINGVRTTFKLNFNDASVFTSDVYQLAQNDLIYIPANDLKLKNLNQDPDIQKKMQIFQIAVSGLSTLAVIVNVLILLKRY